MVILVTPAHLNLLSDTEDAVPTLLNQIFHTPEPGQEFDVLGAVVDRIPYPVVDQHTEKTELHALASNDIASRSVQAGSEGISFFVLDSVSAAPDIWSTPTKAKECELPTVQQRCTLSFILPPVPMSVLSPVDQKERHSRVASRTLQLPVASTIFLNGKTATLLAQRWKTKQDVASSLPFSCIRKTSLQQQTLDMSDGFSGRKGKLRQSLGSYLVPITPTRTITAAVGNIIRRIKVNDHTNGIVPASEELEKAISAAINEHQMPSQQVGIWALVGRSKHKLQDTNHTNQPNTIDVDIHSAILKGHQLHKVLSGGGGWGEKKGLLALDPDPDYSTDPHAFDALLEDDRDDKFRNPQAFEQNVSVDDTVRFYVYRSHPHPHPLSANASDEGSTATPTPLSMTFGSLPSTIDEMPNPLNKLSDDFTNSICKIHWDHFGMLSEQGMSLEVSIHDPNFLPNAEPR